jgi:hypothetical protein
MAFLWCGAGSNRRHKDFQSFALPTELPHRNFSGTPEMDGKDSVF